MSKRIVRRVVHNLMLVSLMPGATACTSWRAHRLVPSSNAGQLPDVAYLVTRRDGSQLLVRDAQLQRDTLHARLTGAPRGTQGGIIAVPMSEVVHVETRRFSAVRTAGVVGGTLVLITAISALVALASVTTDWD